MTITFRMSPRRSLPTRSVAPPARGPSSAVRDARASVPGLPTGFRFHDLRHYFASLLIADGLDVRTVQARLRHSSAKTTLDVYGHMWPDKDEASRAAVAAAIAARAQAGSRTSGTTAER